MKWPWVSRLALDLVLDERDRLREQNKMLTNTVVSLQRKSFGMKEEPPKPTAARDPGWMTEEIPPAIAELVGGWDSEAMRSAVEIDIRNARRQGTPWGEIERLLTEPEEGGDGEDRYDPIEPPAAAPI